MSIFMWNMVGFHATNLYAFELVVLMGDGTAIVVKNPLSPVEHPGGVGVNNELFEESLEQFVVSTAIALF